MVTNIYIRITRITKDYNIGLYIYISSRFIYSKDAPLSSAGAASNVNSYAGYLSAQFENSVFENSKKEENDTWQIATATTCKIVRWPNQILITHE